MCTSAYGKQATEGQVTACKAVSLACHQYMQQRLRCMSADILCTISGRDAGPQMAKQRSRLSSLPACPCCAEVRHPCCFLQCVLCRLHSNQHLWWVLSHQIHCKAHPGVGSGGVVHLHHPDPCGSLHQVGIRHSGMPVFDGSRRGGHLPFYSAPARQMVPSQSAHLHQHTHLCRWAITR